MPFLGPDHAAHRARPAPRNEPPRARLKGTASQRQAMSEQTTAPRNPRALRIPDAATYTGLSESHLRRCIADGRIGAVRYGRNLRVHVSALDAYLRAGDGIE